MVPVPCILGSVFHGVWVIVFIGLVRHYRIWVSCEGSGIHYVVTTAGLMAVFVLCLAGELALAYLGTQGLSAGCWRRAEVCVFNDVLLFPEPRDILEN